MNRGLKLIISVSKIVMYSCVRCVRVTCMCVCICINCQNLTFHIGVQTLPGDTQLTRTKLADSSMASAFVNAMIAPCASKMTNKNDMSDVTVTLSIRARARTHKHARARTCTHTRDARTHMHTHNSNFNRTQRLLSYWQKRIRGRTLVAT